MSKCSEILNVLCEAADTVDIKIAAVAPAGNKTAHVVIFFNPLTKKFYQMDKESNIASIISQLAHNFPEIDTVAPGGDLKINPDHVQIISVSLDQLSTLMSVSKELNKMDNMVFDSSQLAVQLELMKSLLDNKKQLAEIFNVKDYR